MPGAERPNLGSDIFWREFDQHLPGFHALTLDHVHRRDYTDYDAGRSGYLPDTLIWPDAVAAASNGVIEAQRSTRPRNPPRTNWPPLMSLDGSSSSMDPCVTIARTGTDFGHSMPLPGRSEAPAPSPSRC